MKKYSDTGTSYLTETGGDLKKSRLYFAGGG